MTRTSARPNRRRNATSAAAASILIALPALAALAAPGAAGAMRNFAVFDPVLQMTAWTLSAPADWTMEGTMLPGSSCSAATSPIYRMASPDGRVGAYLLPRMDWSWGEHVQPGPDCMPWSQVMAARDVLNLLVRQRGASAQREEAVPELEGMRRQLQAMDAQSGGTRHSQADMARQILAYQADGHAVEERMTVTVQCAALSGPTGGSIQNCSAFVSRQYAPAGELKAWQPTFQAMRLTLQPAWMQRWQAAVEAQTAALSRQQTDALLEQGRLAQAQRMSQHQDFIAGMRQSAEQRTARFQQSQIQRQRQKEDTVDCILDCQRASNDKIRIAVGNCPMRQTQ